jgi:hypothetical protein
MVVLQQPVAKFQTNRILAIFTYLPKLAVSVFYFCPIFTSLETSFQSISLSYVQRCIVILQKTYTFEIISPSLVLYPMKGMMIYEC